MSGERMSSQMTDSEDLTEIRIVICKRLRRSDGRRCTFSRALGQFLSCEILWVVAFWQKRGPDSLWYLLSAPFERVSKVTRD